ncbi:MAG: hypothetical protein JRI49_01445 [Deltaproteobacteria bacterium]|nr:hypothetical protein [Deltaproteobacteria bacterium]
MRKSRLFKTLNCITLMIMATTITTQSLCFADISSSPISETMAAFSHSMDTELGDRVTTLLDKRGLEVDLKNGVRTTVSAGEITLVPLLPIGSLQTATSEASQQNSQFLAYIDHEKAGRFLAFLEVERSKKGKTTSLKIVFPSGRGMGINMGPFYIYQIDASKTEISLQDNDDLENTIVVSDVCEVIGIITLALASACEIFDEPIVCGIAGIMETIYESIC